jgi:sugar transferase (PEP-CTERM/EpsH1 system associated)
MPEGPGGLVKSGSANSDERPLIAHVLFSFDCGGLENGVANLINGLDERAFRHTVIALTGSDWMRQRIQRTDVEVHLLEKREGKDPAAYLRLFRLLRELRPAIVHTRNLGTLDGAMVARLAGVSRCIHGEHGWDVFDPQGASRKYRTLRRVLSPAIHRFVTVSRELEQWLTSVVGIPTRKVQRICNGVDVERFRPSDGDARAVLPPQTFPKEAFVVGTVSRFSAIKDPLALVTAFIQARALPGGERLRLVMVGDGELREAAERQLHEAGAAEAAWLPGARADTPELLRAFDLFVLGSLREGISNTILEAMASGVPVLATRTGGNPELVQSGVTGELIEPRETTELARAILRYATHPERCAAHGRAGRERAVREFSLERMLSDYNAVYRGCLAQPGGIR